MVVPARLTLPVPLFIYLSIYLFICLFIYLLAIFNQAVPVQQKLDVKFKNFSRTFQSLFAQIPEPSLPNKTYHIEKLHNIQE